MTRLDSRFMPVHAWYDKPDQDFSFSMQAAGRLAALVHAVHASGYCVGDLRENNVFISDTGEICLIDTDSFQITDPSSTRTWFCRVGTGEYLPPELLDSSFEKQDIDRLLLTICTCSPYIQVPDAGAHPCREEDRWLKMHLLPRTRLSGVILHMKERYLALAPDYAPSYARIPSSVRSLFHEAFVTGHQHPKARPEPVRWARALGQDMKRIKP